MTYVILFMYKHFSHALKRKKCNGSYQDVILSCIFFLFKKNPCTCMHSCLACISFPFSLSLSCLLSRALLNLSLWLLLGADMQALCTAPPDGLRLSPVSAPVARRSMRRRLPNSFSSDPRIGCCHIGAKAGNRSEEVGCDHGLGLVSVFANDIDLYYSRLLAGESKIRLIDRFDASKFL